MANYIAAARSNAFEVADEEKFLEWVGSIAGLEAKKRDGGRYVLLVEDTDGGGWPNLRDNGEGDDEEIDLFGELSEHLAEGEVAVCEEAGAEKLRYVNAYAIAVNHLGERLSVSITDIYDKVREAGWGEVNGAVS